MGVIIVKSRIVNKDIKYGFVIECVFWIILGVIVNNFDIDVIWDKFNGIFEEFKKVLNNEFGELWKDWDIFKMVDDNWLVKVKELYVLWFKYFIVW